MRGVIVALVATALLSLALLVTGVLLDAWPPTNAGLFGLLCVPVVRNVAFVVVEKRPLPRALAALVGLTLVTLYAWALL